MNRRIRIGCGLIVLVGATVTLAAVLERLGPPVAQGVGHYDEYISLLHQARSAVQRTTVDWSAAHCPPPSVSVRIARAEPATWLLSAVSLRRARQEGHWLMDTGGRLHPSTARPIGMSEPAEGIRIEVEIQPVAEGMMSDRQWRSLHALVAALIERIPADAHHPVVVLDGELARTYGVAPGTRFQPAAAFHP